MAETTLEDQLAADLARQVVTRQAPRELPTFRAISAAYFEDPDRAFEERKRDEKLGFGVESVALLTPYALAIARPVVQLLIAELGKGLKERNSEAIARWVRRIFNKQDEPVATEETEPAPQPLRPEQLDRIRQLALQKGRELALPEREATSLADAMIVSLVIPSSR